MTASLNLPLSPVVPPLSAQQLGHRVFAGEFLLFSSFGAWSRLLRATRQIVRASFADCAHPTRAHLFLSRDEFLRRSEDAQLQVNAPACKQLFATALASLGLADDKLFWDTLGLRISPPQGFAGGFRSATRVHRDTWGSGLPAQINWWAPLWPLAAKRTMGFYPSYWQRELPNSTAQWSFKEYLASRRQAKQGHAATYPATPQPLAEPDEVAVPLLMRPGTLLCFSSAHLHSTIPNTTQLTRFSLEIRTVHLDDLQQGRGAPNVDDRSQQILLGLFSAVHDNSPLKAHWSPSA